MLTIGLPCAPYAITMLCSRNLNIAQEGAGTRSCRRLDHYTYGHVYAMAPGPSPPRCMGGSPRSRRTSGAQRRPYPLLEVRSTCPCRRIVTVDCHFCFPGPAICAAICTADHRLSLSARGPIEVASRVRRGIGGWLDRRTQYALGGGLGSKSRKIFHGPALAAALVPWWPLICASLESWCVKDPRQTTGPVGLPYVSRSV
ncbi:hypothetical protein BC826DRAFT_726169 [Russula brevipes]|nr:hypothetical protein BC826DRAFT_726169 [Russula brevipes]